MVSFEAARILHRGHEFTLSYFVRPGTLGTLVYLHGLGTDFYFHCIREFVCASD